MSCCLLLPSFRCLPANPAEEVVYGTRRLSGLRSGSYLVPLDGFGIVQQVQVSHHGRVDLCSQLIRLDGFQYVAEYLAEVDQVNHVGRVPAVIDDDGDELRHVFLQCRDDLLQDGLVGCEIRYKYAGIILPNRLCDLDECRREHGIAINGACANGCRRELRVDREYDDAHVLQAQG